jgi:hypothetical protein
LWGGGGREGRKKGRKRPQRHRGTEEQGKARGPGLRGEGGTVDPLRDMPRGWGWVDASPLPPSLLASLFRFLVAERRSDEQGGGEVGRFRGRRTEVRACRAAMLNIIVNNNVCCRRCNGFFVGGGENVRKKAATKAQRHKGARQGEGAGLAW